MTFADLVNFGSVAELQRKFDEINEACRRHPNSPRDAGVVSPALFVAHPLRVVSMDLVDRDEGFVVVDSPFGEKTVPFVADDVVDEWVNDDLLSSLA